MGCRRFSAGRGGAGLEDPRCGEGGAAAASRPARAVAVTPLHHWPPPLARALPSHPPAAIPRLGSSPAAMLRLFPGALGPFRRVIGKRAGGSSAPIARMALAPAPRAAPRRFPRARARPPPERAWPPIKEARRARRRHYPLRSERRGGRPRRRVGPSAPPPTPPDRRTYCPHPPLEPVRGGAGELGEGAGPEGRRPLGGERGSPWGGAGPARGQVSPAGLAAPSDGRGPGWRAATRPWSVGCGGAARPSLGAGRWNVIDWAEGGRGHRVRPAPPPPSLVAAPPCPIRLPQVGRGLLAGSSPSPSLQSASPSAPSPFPGWGATSAPFPESPRRCRPNP